MPKPSNFKRTIAITLVIVLLNNIITPSIALALTSGPARPESTSFEPVDTTDMVNLLSGDLAYNIPMIEVPGSGDGYPLSLSYHAGISPDLEASWVGLGWTLNPGAIDRSVSGFPDDFNGQQNTVRDYWDGGSKTTTSVGVNVGLYGVVGVEFGITVAHDTFLGSGVGGQVSLVAQLPVAGLDASLGFAVDPFGETAMIGGLGYGPLQSQFSTNFDSFNAGASLNVLGASINTSGQFSLAAGTSSGRSSVDNANAGKIQTKTKGWHIAIPLPGLSLSISHTYERYWSDETSAVSTFGTLHYPAIRNVYYNTEFDSYYLADINDPNFNLTTNTDPIKSTGGTLPDYDTYSVSGQGISGYMRPYAYQEEVAGKGKNGTTLFRTTRDYDNQTVIENVDQNGNTGSTTIVDVYYTNNPSKLNFRFTDDFSNRYLQQDLTNDVTTLKFDSNPVYGLNDGNYGFDTGTERLASSKNIEYFTNDEIKNGTAALKGFIDTHAAGFDRTKNPDGTAISIADQRIGGFMITNESGVTYHYALPVYAYNEYTKTESVSGVSKFNEQTRSGAYATSWILTAITGPDYVDVNNNGKADRGDWGYWVDFEYGKWAGNYGWRNPYVGTTKDMDQRFQFHSSGNKELYFLDAVITQTHTAIFSKEMRLDAKGVVSDGSGHGPQNSSPTTQLRLDDIILYNNNDLNLTIDQIRNSSSSYNLGGNSPVKNYYGENVIDINDISALSALTPKIIRDIRFNYNYNLCPSTPNSFDAGGNLFGKLTLQSVTTLGKQGVPSLPPIGFEYELPVDMVKTSSNISYLGPKDGNAFIYLFQDPSGVFSEGDLITFKQNNIPYYGLVKAVTASGNGNVLEIRYIGSPPASTSSLLSFSTTKNPPYSPDNHDIWGMYKGDYIGYVGNENLSRLPSRASAKSSDVWSLRRIHQALGATSDIIYEPDTYSHVALYRNASIIVNSVTPVSSGTFQVNTAANFGIDLRDFISVGSKVQLTLAGDYQVENTGQDGVQNFYIQGTSVSSGDVPSLVVTQVTENTVTINNANFYNVIFNSGTTVTGGNMSAGGLGNNYGGGLRIKQIANKEAITNTTMATSYNYNLPANPSMSSGTTSYEPIGPDILNTRSYVDNYNVAIAKGFSNLLGVARLVPAPGIMYEYVGVSSTRTVDGQSVQEQGSTQFQFEVFNEGMLGISNNKTSGGQFQLANVMIRDFSSRVGSLKRVIKYDANNNKLSETINNYLYDQQSSNSADANTQQYGNLLTQFNQQGLIIERTAEGRHNDGVERYLTTTRAVYPNIPTGSTTIDYKTGLVSNTQTLGFDMYSGQAVKTLTYDSYGNRLVTQATPAYRVYPQMGLKSMNLKNANMLRQVAENITYTVDQNNNNTGVGSATATIWSNQTNMLNDGEDAVNTLNAFGSTPLNIWRPYQTFQWMPQDRTGGFTPMANFNSYFNGGSSLPGWVLGSQITLYNKYSKVLEAFDINGNYGATKMDYQQSKVMATASNANYAEMTYAGLEDGVIASTLLPRGINLGSAVITSSTSHTGNNSVQLNAGQSGLSYTINTSKLKTNRNFIASVWMQSTTPANTTLYYRVNGGTAVQATVNTAKVAGQWYQVTLQIPSTALTANSTLEIGCVNNGTATAYFDDFRFKPINSNMTSYVYDPSTGELLYLLDNNNLFAQFQYDAEGRLTKTFAERFGYGVKQTKEHQYNYAH